jgi:hypothetical protein
LEKIVIVTNHAQEHDTLVAALQCLFPECELQIVRKEGTGSGPLPRGRNLCGNKKGIVKDDDPACG